MRGHSPDGAIFHLLRRVMQRHNAQWSAEVPEMTKAQWAVLRAVQAEPGRGQKEIGEEVAVDKATLVPLVARLVDRGWLGLEADPGDRRRRLLQLTAEGRAALARTEPRVDAVDAAALAPLAPEERASLRSLLYRLS